MASLRANEGYLMVDHRYSPGIPADLEAYWIAQGKIHPGETVHAGATYETAIQTCSHCQRVIIMNPLRERERHVCHGCYHYICDGCAHLYTQDRTCHNFYQLMDALQEAAFRAQNLAEV
jgi:hypothetical protein